MLLLNCRRILETILIDYDYFLVAVFVEDEFCGLLHAEEVEA
jgi:hypothetical protein